MHSSRGVKAQGVLRKLRWAILIVLGVFLVMAGVLILKWPFTQAGITRRLERASSAKVEIKRFYSTWFPYPGCVAEEVVFRRPEPGGHSGAEPLLTIHTLRIQSTFHGLFSHPRRIREILAEGARIHLERGSESAGAGQSSSKNGDKGGEQLVIEELRLENAVLEIASPGAQRTQQKFPAGSPQKTTAASRQKSASAGRQAAPADTQRPLTFQIHRAVLRNLSKQTTMPFEISLRTPLPPGEVEVGGWIGPVKEQPGNFRNTPVSGFYRLRQADLSVFHALAGHVSSQGQFSGTLERLAVSGSTDSPDFEVTASRHRVPLSTRFRGELDLRSGDLVLPTLAARLGNTALDAHARVYGFPKTVELDVARGKGQVQDLLLLFSKAPRSAVTGPISFRAVAVLPSEPRPFKERVRLTGDFVIDPAQFSSPRTQAHVDQLSERARGKKDKHRDYDSNDDPEGFERVITGLRGRVVLKDGTAAFSEISFSVPGAEADMNGTYNLVNKQVNLKGKMRMQATVSQATTGAKSFFLKALDPMFKKKGAGAEVKVGMTGTYGHTRFKAGLK